MWTTIEIAALVVSLLFWAVLICDVIRWILNGGLDFWFVPLPKDDDHEKKLIAELKKRDAA